MKKPARITYITQRVLMGIVLAVSIVGLILNEDQSVRGEYIFNIGQCVTFLLVSFLPNFFRKYKLDIPDFIYVIFILFCMAHFFCGEILGFFVKVSWWDSALHTFSGCLIALLSFSLINLLNKTNGKDFKLNIWFASIFAFTMTLAVGAVWEIIEYLSDIWFNSNMQRAYVSTMSGRGEPLVGTAALADTMKDLILDAIGGLAVCIICGICVKFNKLKIEDLSIIKKADVKYKPANVSDGSSEDEKIEVSDNPSKDKETKVSEPVENQQKKKKPKQKA
ncbi:MAG: hypothetical protein E7341_02100 [Clostridiales bacterium]|nr:hypothetical protein [Clostridiales bacterium]